MNQIRSRIQIGALPLTALIFSTLAAFAFPPPQGSIVGWGERILGVDLSHGFVSVSAGGYHNLGLKNDGSIIAWGNNSSRECIVPSPNVGFSAVSAGAYHSIGLKTDGSIVAWGHNGYGQTNIPSLNTGFVAVSAGLFHNLGLKSDGSVVAWGRRDYGETTVPYPNPGFIAVAGGATHSLGVLTNGSIVAWGCGDAPSRCIVPSPNIDFVAVAAGAGHSLGLKLDGTVVAWGLSDQGQADVPFPNTGFTAISAGFYHSLGLQENGSIVAWGRNYEGQSTVPAPNSDFIAVAANGFHSSGLKADGSVVSWGCGDAEFNFGQCGCFSHNNGFVAVEQNYFGLRANGEIDSCFGNANVPPPNTSFIEIASAMSHILGLKADGSITAWGFNGYGQTDVPPPNSGFVRVGAAGVHSIGLKSDSSIVEWGCLIRECGDKGPCLCTELASGPPPPNIGFTSVAAGAEFSLGLKSNGSISAWGKSDFGQTDVPAPNEDFVAVAAGTYHSLGLKADGSVVGWGSDSYGALDAPAPNSGFVDVAASLFHSLGLKSDGSVVAWGCSYVPYDRGQCDALLMNSDIIAIAAGEYENLAIRGSPADYDNNGLIDSMDHAVLAEIIESPDSGPGIMPSVRFWYLFDLDKDQDVDLLDFALFEKRFKTQ